MLKIKDDINLNILREYGFQRTTKKKPKIKSIFSKWIYIYFGNDSFNLTMTPKIVVRQDRTLSFCAITKEEAELIFKMSINGILEEI